MSLQSKLCVNVLSYPTLCDRLSVRDSLCHAFSLPCDKTCLYSILFDVCCK